MRQTNRPRLLVTKHDLESIHINAIVGCGHMNDIFVALVVILRIFIIIIVVGLRLKNDFEKLKYHLH
jgi:hypothetical protein